MTYFIQPCTAAGDTVFLISNELGEATFRISSRQEPTGAKLQVIGDGTEVLAKIKQRVLLNFVRYGISPSTGKSVSVNLRFSANGVPQQILLGGETWKVRGDLIHRDFEIIDVDGSALLRHRALWRERVQGYEVTLTGQANELMLLCICACIDFTAMGDPSAVVAIN